MLCQLLSGGLFRAPVFEKLSGTERLKNEIDLVLWKKAWRNLKNLLFSSQMEHKCVVKRSCYLSSYSCVLPPTSCYEARGKIQSSY